MSYFKIAMVGAFWIFMFYATPIAFAVFMRILAMTMYGG